MQDRDKHASKLKHSQHHPRQLAAFWPHHISDTRRATQAWPRLTTPQSTIATAAQGLKRSCDLNQPPHGAVASKQAPCTRHSHMQSSDHMHPHTSRRDEFVLTSAMKSVSWYRAWAGVGRTITGCADDSEVHHPHITNTAAITTTGPCDMVGISHLSSKFYFDLAA
jgi:hypothetical protein